MNTAKVDNEAMKELVTEYYPDFFNIQSKWSKWTLGNVYAYIAGAGYLVDQAGFLNDVRFYMGEAVADSLESAQADYVEYVRICSDNRIAAEEAGLFYDKYVKPLLPMIDTKTTPENKLWRQRFAITAFIKGGNSKHMTEWENAAVDVQQLIRRARELYYDVVREDVDALISLLPGIFNAESVKFHCADRNIDDVLEYIRCDAPDFDSIEPSLDEAIKAARMRTGAMYETDPHDIMGKIVVPFAVGKHKLSKANMDILHDRLGQFITAVMRLDSNITSVFADCEPVMRDMAVDVANAYRNEQYSAVVELERHVLLALDDSFSKEILQYYIPAVLAYVVGKSEECDVPAGKLRDCLDQARKEHAAIEQHKSISKNVLLDWDRTLTKEQAELMEMFRIEDRQTREDVIKQLRGYNATTLLAYIRGEVDFDEQKLSVITGDLLLHVNRAKSFYHNDKRRKELNASKEASLDWSSTLTARQRELVDLMVFADNCERDLVIKALLGYNVDELLGYVRGDVKLYADGLNDTLALALKRTRLNYLSKTRQGINKGAKNMAMTINYHGRLEVANNELKGTLTLSIDGELAIVDVDAIYGESKVRYNWVTLPKVGYDTTLHSQVVWLGHDAAVNIIVVVYKDGGIASTVTFTKDLSGVVL